MYNHAVPVMIVFEMCASCNRLLPATEQKDVSLLLSPFVERECVSSLLVLKEGWPFQLVARRSRSR